MDPGARARSRDRALAALLLAAFPFAFLLLGAWGTDHLYRAWTASGLITRTASLLITRTLAVAAAAVGSGLLVRWCADEDGVIAGWIVGPLLAVPLTLNSLAEHGPSWRLLGPGLGVAVGLVLGGLALRRQRPWSTWMILGLLLTVLLPSALLGLHEWARAWEDWPCSSLNWHLGIAPWIRILAMCLSVGLLTAAGRCWLRRKGRGLAIALAAGAVLVQAPAGYLVTRSGCGGRVTQGLELGPEAEIDPGCSVAGCYCGIAHDGIGRPMLLRKGAPAARLWVPGWLLEGDRSTLETVLVFQDSAPLPPEQCGD